MPRLVSVLGAAALQLVALVLAHELVFLARWGSRYNEVLAHSGHGESWSTAVATAVALGVALAALATWRLARLGILVRRAGGTGATSMLEAPGSPLRALLFAGPASALLTAGLLTLQEHVERSAIGFGPTGPAILLAPEYAGGLWIALGVGFLVGLIAALFAWRRSVLAGRLRSARVRPARVATPGARRPRIGVRPAIDSLLGRHSALRAPPGTPELLPAG